LVDHFIDDSQTFLFREFCFHKIKIVNDDANVK